MKGGATALAIRSNREKFKVFARACDLLVQKHVRNLLARTARPKVNRRHYNPKAKSQTLNLSHNPYDKKDHNRQQKVQPFIPGCRIVRRCPATRNTRGFVPRIHLSLSQRTLYESASRSKGAVYLWTKCCRRSYASLKRRVFETLPPT